VGGIIFHQQDEHGFMFFFHGGLHGWNRASKDAAEYSKQDASHNRSGGHP